MPALAINGISIPVAYDSWTPEQPLKIGEESRAHSGLLRESVRAVKWSWSGETVIRPQASTIALERLLMGEGHNWDFSGQHLYSTKGVGPVGITGAPTYNNLFGAFAGRFLRCTSSQAVVFPLEDLTGPAGATMMFRYRLGSSGATTHYGFRTDALSVMWVNGGQTAAAPISGITIDSELTVGMGSSDVFFGDLVVLPYLAPVDWFAQVSASPRPWGGVPRGLWATGDLLAGRAPTRVSGTVDRGKVKRSGGGLRSSCGFRLSEV